MRVAQVTGAAPLASPTFTGTVSAPTLNVTTSLSLNGTVTLLDGAGLAGTSGYVLSSTGTGTLWVPSGGGSSVSVNSTPVSSPNFQNSAGVTFNVTGSNITLVTTLAGDSDVLITSPVNGQVLTYVVPGIEIEFNDSVTDLLTPSAWTTSGGIATSSAQEVSAGITSILANPGQGADFNTGVPTFANTTTQFSIYINSSGLCDFYFGANSSGAGPALRLDSRAFPSGFFTSASWFGTGQGPDGSVSSITWHTIRIVTNVAGTQASWYVDGTPIETNVSITLNGGFLGIYGDGGGAGAYFSQITVTTNGTDYWENRYAPVISVNGQTGIVVLQLPLTFSPVTNEFLTGYTASTGLFTAAQPTYAGISGTPQLAQTFTAPTHEWVNSYDAVTGLFTATQPAYADISGTPNLSVYALLSGATFTGTVSAPTVDVTTSLSLNGTVTLLDGTGSAGTSGQVLSSTVTGTAWITSSSSPSFSAITTGTNTTATMTVGSGASIVVTGAGVVEATQVQAVVVSGTAPTTGQVLTATSPTAANWQTPTGGGGSSYSLHKTITIDHTKCGSSNSAGFPFLFSGTYSYLATVANGGNVNSQFGWDIAFSLDSAGTQMIPFEMQSYNPVTGAVVFWVSVPTISSTVDTVIYLQYDNVAINTNLSNPSAVWASNNFILVRHFEQDCRDSSGNGIDEQMSYLLSFVSGQIGNGVSLNGSIAINDGSRTIFLPTSITTSMWINPQSLSNAYSALISYTNENAPNGGYALLLKSSGQIAMYFLGSGGSTSYDPGSHTLSTSTWYHLVATWDGTNLVGYINGASDGTASSARNYQMTVPPSGSNTESQPQVQLIGNSSIAGRQYTGYMDEFRISSVIRSADWILTEYNNQNSPSTFYTVT